MNIGGYELKEFVQPDGLELQMRLRGSNGPWQDFDIDVIYTHKAQNGALVLEQDVWWTTKVGVTQLVDDLAADHRQNIATMLIAKASRIYTRKRQRELMSMYLQYVERADEKGWPVDESTEASCVNEKIREEINAGADLEYVRESKLFQRMLRDLPELADA